LGGFVAESVYVNPTPTIALQKFSAFRFSGWLEMEI